jgi:hypothetical protein
MLEREAGDTIRLIPHDPYLPVILGQAKKLLQGITHWNELGIIDSCGVKLYLSGFIRRTPSAQGGATDHVRHPPRTKAGSGGRSAGCWRCSRGTPASRLRGAGLRLSTVDVMGAGLGAKSGPEEGSEACSGYLSSTPVAGGAPDPKPVDLS